MNLNESAPDFELPDLKGIPHRLNNYRGRIIIMNFWSCECPQSERTDQARMPMSVPYKAWKRFPKYAACPSSWWTRITSSQIYTKRRPRRTSSWLTGRASCAIAARRMMSHFAGENQPVSSWMRRSRLCSRGVRPLWQRLPLMAVPSFERFDSC